MLCIAVRDLLLWVYLAVQPLVIRYFGTGREKPDNDAASLKLNGRDNREWEEDCRAMGQSRASSYHSVVEIATTV